MQARSVKITEEVIDILMTLIHSEDGDVNITVAIDNNVIMDPRIALVPTTDRGNIIIGHSIVRREEPTVWTPFTSGEFGALYSNFIRDNPRYSFNGRILIYDGIKNIYKDICGYTVEIVRADGKPSIGFNFFTEPEYEEEGE